MVFVTRDTAPKDQARDAPTRDVGCRTGWSVCEVGYLSLFASVTMNVDVDVGLTLIHVAHIVCKFVAWAVGEFNRAFHHDLNHPKHTRFLAKPRGCMDSRSAFA